MEDRANFELTDVTVSYPQSLVNELSLVGLFNIYESADVSVVFQSD
jgi:hypothetical protein